jgi:hypothetical protein
LQLPPCRSRSSSSNFYPNRLSIEPTTQQEAVSLWPRFRTSPSAGKQKISATHSTPSNALMALFASSIDSNETNAKPRLIPDSRSLTIIFFLNDNLVSRGSFPRFAEGVELGSQLTSSATLPCCLNSLRRVSSVMYGDSLLRFG